MTQIFSEELNGMYRRIFMHHWKLCIEARQWLMAQVKASELNDSYVVGEAPCEIRVVVGFFRTGHLPLG